MFSGGTIDLNKDIEEMGKLIETCSWAAVRVQRGFVTEVRGFREYEDALRCTLAWKPQMNPDYDEVAVCELQMDAMNGAATLAEPSGTL